MRSISNEKGKGVEDPGILHSTNISVCPLYIEPHTNSSSFWHSSLRPHKSLFCPPYQMFPPLPYAPLQFVYNLSYVYTQCDWKIVMLIFQVQFI